MNIFEALQSCDELSSPDKRLFLPAISKYKGKIDANNVDSQFLSATNPYFGAASIINQPILAYYLKQPKLGFISFGLLIFGLLNILYSLIFTWEEISRENFVDLIESLYGICSLVLIHVYLTRSNYIDGLMTIWKSLSFSKYKMCYQYFTHNRKKFHLVIYIAYGIIIIEELIQIITQNYVLFGYSFSISKEPITKLLMGLIVYGSKIISIITILSQDLVLIDTCFLVYSALCFIRTNLEQFNQDSINRTSLRFYREKYTLTCDLIQSANNYSKFYILAMYTSCMIILIIRVYFTFFVPNTIKVVIIDSFFHFNHLITISIITFLLIQTHSLAKQVQDELYPITFKTDQISSLYEIILFMYRVGRQDVGFTFGNLFVITPNFISSLVTISATLIIAIPSFVPYYKKN